MSFDSKLLEGMLVCTKCRGPLVRDQDHLVCTGPDCRMQFAIIDEIPNMLLEDAKAIADADWKAIMQRQGRNPVNGAR